MILDLLAEGVAPDRIIADHFPQIDVEDVHACIAYGSAMSDERYVAVLLEPSV
jgi:uncharacterized protein (DUF433 family)